MKTCSVTPSAKAPGQSYSKPMKTMKRITTLLLLLVLAIAVQAQDPSVTITFDGQKDPPTVSLVEGEGTLYHYYNQSDRYRGIYYLYTDASVVKMAPKSRLANRSCYLSFDTNDRKSEWLKNDTTILGNDAVITQSMLDDMYPISFKWEERAHLLISAMDYDQLDNRYTLLLIVLPMPPQDTIITKIDKDITVDKDSCMINGSVTIHRTGRIIIDSVYVEGEKANTTYHYGSHKRDTPYYRNEGFANVKIQCPWNQESSELDLVVYFTRFNDNGTMDHSHTDFKLSLFEKSFFAKYWTAIVVVILVLLAIVALVILLIRRNSNAGSSSGDIRKLEKEIDKLKKERRRLEDECAERVAMARKEYEHRLKDQLQQKEEEIRELKDHQKCIKKEYESRFEDQLARKEVEISQLMAAQESKQEEEFAQKCEELINEIERIRAMGYKDNASLAALDDRLRALERIIFIKKQ